MYIQAFTNGFIAVDKLCAFVPVVSTVTSALNLIFIIFIKCVYEKPESSENQGFFGRYYTHLTKIDSGNYHHKLLIPFYNIYVAFKVYCCKKAANSALAADCKEAASSASAVDRPEPEAGREILIPSDLMPLHINPPGLKLVNDDNTLNAEAREKLEIEGTLVFKDGSNSLIKGVQGAQVQGVQGYVLSDKQWHQCLVAIRPDGRRFLAGLTIMKPKDADIQTWIGSNIVLLPENIFLKFHENLSTDIVGQIIKNMSARLAVGVY